MPAWGILRHFRPTRAKAWHFFVALDASLRPFLVGGFSDFQNFQPWGWWSKLTSILMMGWKRQPALENSWKITWTPQIYDRKDNSPSGPGHVWVQFWIFKGMLDCWESESGNVNHRRWMWQRHFRNFKGQHIGGFGIRTPRNGWPRVLLKWNVFLLNLWFHQVSDTYIIYAIQNQHSHRENHLPNPLVQSMFHRNNP